jgi:predicted nucleotidyltransferase
MTADPQAAWDRALRESEQAAREDLPRLVEQLKAMGADLIILFGSAARGEATGFSDLDLLVRMPSDLPFVERLAEIYRRIRLNSDCDIFAYTPEEFERGNPFIRRALAEGKVLYDARREA